MRTDAAGAVIGRPIPKLTPNMLPLRPFTKSDAPRCCVDLVCIIAASKSHLSLTLTEGALVCTEGHDDGCADEVGDNVGTNEGFQDGPPLGSPLGSPLGADDGCPDG